MSIKQILTRSNYIVIFGNYSAERNNEDPFLVNSSRPPDFYFKSLKIVESSCSLTRS